MSSPLTTGELALLRQDSTQSLPQTLTVLRLTSLSDARGGMGQVYEVAHTNMPCRAAPGSTRTEAERELADRLGIISPWMVTVPWDADVLMDDRLVVEGMTLEVTFIDTQRADLIAKRILGKQVS